MEKKEVGCRAWAKRGSALKIIIIVVAVAAVLSLGITGVIMASPKNTVRTSFARLAGSVVRLEPTGELAEKFNTESHSSETEINVGSQFFSVGGELRTSYDVDANEGGIEVSLLTLFNTAMYVREDQIALQTPEDLYVYDFESSADFEGNMNLSEHLNVLVNPDVKMDEDMLGMFEKKSIEYFNMAISLMPSDNMSRIKETFDFYGESRELKGIEVAFTNDEIADYLISFFEEMRGDDDLETLINEYIAYMNSSGNVSSSGIEIDPIVLDDFIDDAIEEMEAMKESDEYDLTIGFFHENRMLKAVSIAVDSEDESIELTAAFEVKKEDYSLSVDLYPHFENMEDTAFELDAYKNDKDMHLSAEFRESYSADMNMGFEMNFDVVGTGKDAYSIDGSILFSDYFGTENEITLTGQSQKEGNVTTAELDIDVREDGVSIMKADIEAGIEEVRKDSEYEVNCEISISTDEGSFDVTIDNTTKFGKDIDNDVPEWSKGKDYYLDSIDEFEDILTDMLYSFGL